MFEPRGAGMSIVESQSRHEVRGWGMDAGLTWAPDLPLEPRLSLGFALGSGDTTPQGGTDRAFRQTGLHGNESAFGGVQRFHRYGTLLRPELSNLRILTAGIGFSVLKSSSLDVLFHDYRQLEPTLSLRNAAIELALTSQHEHIGSEFDVILALEEWEAFERSSSSALSAQDRP